MDCLDRAETLPGAHLLGLSRFDHLVDSSSHEGRRKDRLVRRDLAAMWVRPARRERQDRWATWARPGQQARRWLSETPKELWWARCSWTRVATMSAPSQPCGSRALSATALS